MTALEHVTATFKVVTPLFVGDAERQASRLSLASFKGQLRWWWRALMWAEIRAAVTDAAAALAKLKDREERLFGTAGSDNAKGRGQSRVLMRLVAADLGKAIEPPSVLNKRGDAASLEKWRDVVGEGARYLGYGCINAFTTFEYEKDAQGQFRKDSEGRRIRKKDVQGRDVVEKYAGQLERSCFPAGGNFTIQLAFHPLLCRKERDGKLEPELIFDKRKAEYERDMKDVMRALKLLGLLGGLGARSRRGWGSLSLQSLEWRAGEKTIEEWTAPTTSAKPHSITSTR